MKYSVSIAELKTMSAQQRERRVGELVEATRRPPNGEVAELAAEIARFEQMYGCPTGELRGRLADGRLQENAEVCRWLMLDDMRDRLAKLSSRSR